MVNFMKKTLRGIAAIVASAMVASALGAVNVFATDLTPGSGLTASGDNYTADVDLSVTKVTGTTLGYTSTPTWNIVVNTTELSWQVKTFAGTQALTWNPATGTYSTSGEPTGAAVGFNKDTTDNPNYTNADNTANTADDFDKTFTVTNHSNFNVGLSVATSNVVTEDAAFVNDHPTQEKLFDVVNGSASLTTSNQNAIISIRPDPDAIDAYLNNAGLETFSALTGSNTYKLGKATMTFSRSGGLYNFDTNTVGEPAPNNQGA
jgi:hypothetical protein